ncbi:hypothetical protein ACGFQG_23330 [Nocardia fluminea]
MIIATVREIANRLAESAGVAAPELVVAADAAARRSVPDAG